MPDKATVKSRSVLAGVMLRVLVINMTASAAGQAYSELLRSSKTRVFAPSHPTVVAASVVALCVLLALASPLARRVIASPMGWRHTVAVGCSLAVLWGGGSWLATKAVLAAMSVPQRVAIDMAGALLWFGLLARFGWSRAQHAFGPALAWLDENTTPTAEDRSAIAHLPIEVALFALPYWTMLGVYNLVTNTLTPHLGLGVGLGIFLGIMMTWAATAAITYLIAERRLRPVFTEAFQSRPLPDRATAGITQRLVAAWALGSGIPLLFVMASPSAMKVGGVLSNQTVVTILFVFLGAIGLVAGFFSIAAAARSLAEPMGEIRRGLQRVRQGDLSVDIAVDDAGEVGLVEAGFNDMVAGLRERAVLQDLFGRHVGSEVALQALEEGAVLGGEMRDVTVFFVDLVGSTALVEAVAPSEVVLALNRFFTAVVHAVSSEGGWVNKFEGDGALCVFGAPASQADHAARALRAVCALHEMLVGVADAGIGVASGPAVVGNVGAEERYEYTVVGRPVHLASRLTDEAKRRPSRMLAAADVVSAGGVQGWRTVGPVDLRGFPEPVVVCEPTAVAAAANLRYPQG